MIKKYWWCKKTLIYYNETPKEKLMFLLDKGLYFKLDLLSSVDNNYPFYFLFGSESKYTETSDGRGLMIRYYYSSIESNHNYSFNSGSLFENRLINAEYIITVLTKQEFNEYIK